MSNLPDPAEALAAIAEARRGVHDRVATDGWRYDLSYAAIVAGMIGSQALDIPFNVSGMSLGILLLVMLFQSEARRTGVRVTGVSPRRARWVAIVLALVLAGVMLGMVVAHRTVEPAVFPYVVGGVMAVSFGLALVGSRVWRRVYRAEMGKGE